MADATDAIDSRSSSSLAEDYKGLFLGVEDLPGVENE